MAANLKIKVIQTSDSETGYKTLLDVNRKINEEYCRKMGYEYLAYYGIKRGYYPCQATFNRIYLMEDELDRKAVDWVLYIDADAVVAEAIAANEANAPTVVPGGANRTLAGLAKVLPEGALFGLMRSQSARFRNLD